jgi:hypothetical protein
MDIGAWLKIVKEIENLRYFHPSPFRIGKAKLIYDVNPDQRHLWQKRQDLKSFLDFFLYFDFPVRALDTHGGVSCIVNSTADGRLRINKSVPLIFKILLIFTNFCQKNAHWEWDEGF